MIFDYDISIATPNDIPGILGLQEPNLPDSGDWIFSDASETAIFLTLDRGLSRIRVCCHDWLPRPDFEPVTADLKNARPYLPTRCRAPAAPCRWRQVSLVSGVGRRPGSSSK